MKKKVTKPANGSAPSEALTVPVANATATVAVEFGVADYEIASAHMSKYYGMLRHHGAALILARLMIAVPLAMIRAHDLRIKEAGGKPTALKSFYTLAARGAGEVPKMSKRTLERCLQVFDAYCKEKNILKKEVPLLPGISTLKDEQLELWAEKPPENGNELMSSMLAWAQTRGLVLNDEEIDRQITSQPHVKDPDPTDPEAEADAEAATWFEGLCQYLTTDPHFQQPDKSFLELTPEELAERDATWTRLEDTAMKQLPDLCDRLKASAERMIKIRSGRVSTKRNPSFAKATEGKV
jgi:hypothetical protein